MQRSFSWVITVLILVLGNFSSESAFGKSVTFKVKVVDSDKQPVGGATLWFLTNDEDQSFGTDVMPRLVRRYAMDADFVFSITLHPALLVAYTNQKGEATLKFGEGDLRGIKRLSLQIAAIKRGYTPAIQFDDAPARATRNLQLTIARDKDAVIDPRMDEIDRSRAQAWDTEGTSIMSAKRQELLLQLHQNLQALASQLEREGSKDQAAAVYYNLAYLPSVNIERDSIGRIVSQGFTNGYDDKSPERRANKLRALELNQSHPQLAYKKLFDRYESEGVLIMGDASKAGRRHEYIVDTERFIREHGERMWPWIYKELWQAYQEEKNHQAACATIQRFYAFEPSYFSVKEWRSVLASFQSWFHIKKAPAVDCSIPDLPARNN